MKLRLVISNRLKVIYGTQTVPDRPAPTLCSASATGLAARNRLANKGRMGDTSKAIEEYRAELERMRREIFGES
jgi:hypothetical protein